MPETMMVLNLRGFTAGDLQECAKREVKLRRQLYPRWVADKRLSQAKASSEIDMMETIAGLLGELAARERLL